MELASSSLRVSWFHSLTNQSEVFRFYAFALPWYVHVKAALQRIALTLEHERKRLAKLERIRELPAPM